MAGIINTAIDKNNPLKSVAGYTPEKASLDKTTDTVQGQIKTIIDDNSPLMQQAVTRSKAAANQKGLVNSSMAVTAGQSALYDAALPIASQDAATYNQNKQFNANAGNEAMQFTAAGQNQAESQVLSGQQNIQQIQSQTDSQSRLMSEKSEIDKQMLTADAETKTQLMNRQAEINKELATMESGFSKEMENLRAANQKDLETMLQTLRGEQAQQIAGVEAQYRGLLQASDSAARTFSQTSADIGAILSNPEIPADQKQQLVDKQIQLLQGSLAVIGGIANLDLNDLLTFE